MNKMFNIFIFSLLFLNGCASYFNKKINQEKTEDLAKNFEIPKDTFEKFKVSEELKGIAAPESVKQLNVAVFSEKKVPPLKEKLKSIAVKKITKTPSVIVKDFSPLPADYPASLSQLDEQSKKVWSLFKNYSRPEENMIIEVFFLGIKVGNLAVTNVSNVRIGEVNAFHLKGRFITEKFYETFYKIDDTLESFVQVQDFLPLRYSLLQRESGQKVDDLQLFDYEKLKTFTWFKKVKDNDERKSNEEIYIPRYIQDSFSVIFFVRGLPLKKGDQYEIPVVNKAKIWITKISVLGEDEVRINDQWLKAIKLKAENYELGKDEKKSSVEFWYSNDQHRMLLKFMAKVKIGSVEGKLNLFEPGK